MSNSEENLQYKEFIQGAYLRWFNNISTLELNLIRTTLETNLPPRIIQQYKPGSELDLESLITSMAISLASKPIPKHPARARREHHRSIRRKITHGTEIVAPPSDILKLGRDSHVLIETITQNPGKAPVALANYSLGLSQNPSSGEPLGITFTQIPRTSPVTLIFSEPPINLLPDNILSWAADSLSLNLNLLKQSLGKLPSSPYEVELALRDENSHQLLTRCIENYVILVGPSPSAHLGLIEKSDNQLKVSINPDSEFPLLNLLSLSRSVLESLHRSPNPKLGQISEIPVGNCVITNDNTATYTGGKMDLLTVSLSENFRDTSLASHLTMSQICRLVSSRFGSQSSRYRHVDPDTGGFNTRLPRTALSLISEIWGMVGFNPELLHALRLHITDYKFLAGDGGWFTTFNRDLLPDPEHKKQLEEYLFLLLAQLARLDKRAAGQGLDPLGGEAKKLGISLDEIVNFAFSNKVIDNLKGTLEYQLPEKCIGVDIKLPDSPSELRQLGEEIIKRRIKDKTSQADALLVRALASLLSSSPDISIKVLRPLREIPASLERLCFEYQNTIYLNLQELEKKKFFRAIHFQQEGCYLLWSTEAGVPLRISIDGKRGKFSLNFDYYQISGVLIQNETQKGVYQGRNELLDSFINHVWETIPTDQTKKTIISQLELTSWVDDQGKEHQFTTGKPNICRLDPFSNTWSIAPEILDQVLETNSGKTANLFGYYELAQSLETKTGRDLLCPLPFHPPPDKRTPSAHYYPEVKNSEKPHIHCFRCSQNISVPGRASFLGETHIYVPPPESLTDFINVPPTRRLVSESLMKISQVLLTYSPTAQDYLKSRGLDPSDLCQIGYLPTELMDFLSELINKQVDKTSKSGSVRLESLPELYESINKILESVTDALDGDFIRSRLDVALLKRLRTSGVISKRGNERAQSRAGGRIIFPLYWVDTKSNESRLVMSELYGRAVYDSSGQSLAGDPDHFKFPPARKGHVYNPEKKRWLHRAPSGYWLSSPPEKFLLKTQETQEVVVVEAPLDGISLGIFVPRYADQILAICGSNPGFLMAFLRFMRIEKVIMGTDFDDPGQESRVAIGKMLNNAGVKTSSIESILESVIPGLTQVIGNPPKFKDLNALLTGKPPS